MKMLCFLALSLFLFAGCTKTSTNPVLTAVTDAGCAIETSISTGFSQSIATALSCTNTAAIQASLTAALGNVNLCPAATAAQAQAAKAGGAKPMGIVGSLACPIAVNTIMGFLTNSIPTAWGCSAGGTAAALSTAITTACVAAVPI